MGTRSHQGLPRRCWLGQLGSAALDLLLPRRCAACNVPVADAQSFCVACQASLIPVVRGCPCCGHPEHVALCADCRSDPPPFGRARAPLIYGGAIADAIRQLKYGGRMHLVSPLASLMLLTLPELRPADVIIPVPLHCKRLRERGFNQAALFARRVARALRRPIACNAAKRLRATLSQPGLSRAERYRNVSGAFVARATEVRGRRVLVVDDVLTTGATARACCHALLRAGAAQVDVLTLTRAVP